VEFEFLLNGMLQKIFLERIKDKFLFSDGEKTYEADIQHISPQQISILIDDVSFRIYIARDRDCRYLSVNGQQFTVKEPHEEKEDFRKGEEKTPEGMLLVKAPMPGKVIKICVSEKESVRKNQNAGHCRGHEDGKRD